MDQLFTWDVGGDGKRIYIHGPWNLNVTIDHDDVDHDQVERDAEKLVKLLHSHWKIIP